MITCSSGDHQWKSTVKSGTQPLGESTLEIGSISGKRPVHCCRAFVEDFVTSRRHGSRTQPTSPSMATTHSNTAGRLARRQAGISSWCSHKICRGSQTHAWHRCFRYLLLPSFLGLLRCQELPRRFVDLPIRVQAQRTVGQPLRKVRRRDQEFDLLVPTCLQSSCRIHIFWIPDRLRD